MSESSTTTTEVSTESSAAQPSQTGAEALRSTETAATEQTADEKAAAEAEAAEKSKRDSAQKRIDKAVRSQRETERALEASRLETEALRKQLAAKDPEQARIQLEQDEIDRRAEAKAKQMLEHRDARAKITAFDANGTQDYGDEWLDKCNAVAALGATKRPDFLPVVSDIENGHRAVFFLAEDPDLTEKILAMSPHKMAIELAKLAEKPLPKAAKKISGAPEPIKPVGGSNKGDGYRANMSVEEHIKWVEKNEAKR